MMQVEKRLYNKLLIIIFFISLPVCLFAQAGVLRDCNIVYYPTSALSYNIDNGWYAQAGVGAQILFSKNSSSLDFGKRITPSFNISVGKWLSPLYGLRIQINGVCMNGYSSGEGLFINDPLDKYPYFGNYDPVIDYVSVNSDGSYRNYLRYMNIHPDFQLSLANIFFTTDVDRNWDVITSVGLGYMRVFKHKGIPCSNVMTGNWGLILKKRVCETFDVNVEVSQMLMPDSFDGRITNKNYESALSLTLGTSYKF
jgi:hypothetical protein